MYVLVIDGWTAEKADYVEPLIRRLNEYARDTKFDEASIKDVGEPSPDQTRGGSSQIWRQ